MLEALTLIPVSLFLHFWFMSAMEINITFTKHLQLYSKYPDEDEMNVAHYLWCSACVFF